MEDGSDEQLEQQDEHSLTNSQLEAITDRVAQRLDDRGKSVSRRGVLTALGLGGLATFGVGSASAQAAGQVGTASNPIDVIAYDVEAQNSFTDPAGVTHTSELADIDDVGGGGASQPTTTFTVRRTDADEYQVRDSSGSVVFTESNISNAHNAIGYAVDNLPSDGGRVVLGEGQFNIIENQINLSSNDTLTGQGRSTVLKFNDGITLANPSGGITIVGTSSNPVVNAEVSHLAIDGNKSNVSAGHLDGELINVSQAEEISIHDTYGFDSINEHIDLDETTNSTFYNNHAENCDGWGIHNSTGSGQNRIINNYVRNCGVANSRGGIDQFKNSAGSCVCVGNVSVDNYRNFEIEASGAIVSGNQSITGDNPDIWSGVESAGDSGTITDGDGISRNIYVIPNGASDPTDADAEDIIFEEEA